MDDATLAARIAAIPFFQRFPIRGIMTPGRHDIAEHLHRVALPERLDGLRVLDAGCCDGAVAFECERRGAREVVALDHPDWGYAGTGVARRAGFDLAREALGSAVVPVVADIETDDLAPLGTFDLVLLLGVIYHLKAPLPATEQVGRLVAPGGLLVVESHVGALNVARPAFDFYPGAELGGDPTCWFCPNPAGVIALLNVAGFDRAAMVGGRYGHNAWGARAVFHARRG
jgi:tRNA (mo5U34)-methyltransferase